MNDIRFNTTNLEFTFEKDTYRILEIKDNKSSKVFCFNGSQSIIIRNPLHISDPILLSHVKNFFFSEKEIRLTFYEDPGENFADLVITDDELYGARFSLSVSSPEIIWLVEWKLTGFDFDKVIVPALGGQMLTKEMTPDVTLSYKYPFWWNAQFVIGEHGGDGIWLHTKDPGPDLKLLRVRKTEKDFQLFMGFENAAPLNSRLLKAEWFIDSYSDSWKKPVDIHRQWLENAFELKELEKNSFNPGWVKDINFILELWGMRKDQPEPHHTFEQMIERINQFQDLHSPEKTLLYIPGFAENGIDSHAPDYNPSAKCGGPEKFIELIERAHELKYRVMLHTNVLAMTFTHKLYNEFKKYQVIDPFNHRMCWAMDIDGDWLAEDYFAYMNPGFKQWGDLMEQTIGELITKYKADAIFLDQTLLAFNASVGPNFLIGMREHIKRLQKVYPGILFAGEGINEQVLPSLPFVQIHGIDSLTEVHGMEGRKKWRKIHPVSSYLFEKYTRFSAHLLTKYPANPMFRFQEDSYKKLNVIPALCLYDHKQKMDIPEVHKLIKRAKGLPAKSQIFV